MSVDTVTATTDRSHEADIVSSRTDQPSHGDDRMSPHREGTDDTIAEAPDIITQAQVAELVLLRLRQ
jgi:hypothetical protein